MDGRLVKHPPRGGVRYSTTVEIQERLRTTSNCMVKIPGNGHSVIDHKLYDQIKQSLFQAELSLNRAIRLPSEKAYFYLNVVQTILKEVLEQVYELLLSLHPSILNQFGLLALLLWYFESYTTKTNILVNFKHHGLTRDFTSEISNAAFRIVKEALDDISCNSSGTEVTVQIWIEKEVIHIWIENYRISSVPAKASLTSANIKSIEEQARALGGKVVIDSSSEPIERLIVELPLLEHSRDISLS